MDFFLLNFIPVACPACATEFNFSESLAKNDFKAGCSFSCTCGVKYQFVELSTVQERLGDTLDSYMLEN